MLNTLSYAESTYAFASMKKCLEYPITLQLKLKAGDDVGTGDPAYLT
jgi:hypothetical protein